MVFVVFSLGLVVSGVLKVVMAPKIKEADVAELILTGLISLVVAISLIVMNSPRATKSKRIRHALGPGRHRRAKRILPVIPSTQSGPHTEHASRPSCGPR